MNRDYSTGVHNNIEFFTGIEVEHTPAIGLKTLFVVGVQDPARIVSIANRYECQHIYLGANQSFDPGPWNIGDWGQSDLWIAMVSTLLKSKLLITLDFDVMHVPWIVENGFSEHDNFIPQISVKIPYIQLLGYNAMVKIDDSGFAASNPGVWCHSLHDLQSRNTFTPWNKYGKDSPLEDI